MKRTLLTWIACLMGVFALSQAAQAQQSEMSGGISSTNKDIFLVNDDESEHDAALRLQNRYGNTWRAWNVWHRNEDGKLHFSYWSRTNGFSNDNENDVGTTRMTLTSDGKLGLRTYSPEAYLHIQDNGSSAGARFLQIGDDTYFTDIDAGNTLGLYGKQNSTIANLKMGSGGITLYSTGNKLGVGKSNPSEMLDVNGTVKGAAVLGTALYTQKNNNGASDYAGMKADGGNLIIGSDGAIRFQETDANVTRVYFDVNGNKVGIGTESVSAMLTVAGDVSVATSLTAGTVSADQVTVATGTFPDYVFAPSYNLMPLREVEAFIAANRHLPNIPAASEVIANGIDLGEMNVLLMEKVEELTLYTIEQENRLDAQTIQLQTQQQQLDAQAAAIAAMRAELDSLKK